MEEDPWGRGPNQEGASGHAVVTIRMKTKRSLETVWGAPVVRVEEEAVVVEEAAEVDDADAAWGTEWAGTRALDVYQQFRRTRRKTPQRPRNSDALSAYMGGSRSLSSKKKPPAARVAKPL